MKFHGSDPIFLSQPLAPVAPERRINLALEVIPGWEHLVGDVAAVDGIRLGEVQIQPPPLTSCDSVVYLLNLPLLQSPDLRMELTIISIF